MVYLRLRLHTLYALLSLLTPDSVLWEIVDRLRQDTLSNYADLVPFIRRITNDDPSSVICVF